MPSDTLSNNRGLEAPAIAHRAIIPNDTLDLSAPPRVLYCNNAGTVALRDQFGVDLTYTLAQGQILPISPVRVLATGTTATIYGWF
jgi:hypothetical protein